MYMTGQKAKHAIDIFFVFWFSKLFSLVDDHRIACDDNVIRMRKSDFSSFSLCFREAELSAVFVVNGSFVEGGRNRFKGNIAEDFLQNFNSSRRFAGKDDHDYSSGV